MTKRQKRYWAMGLSSALLITTAIPTSLALVSCANEQDQTNSNASNANKPTGNKPSNKPNSPGTNKPNPPSQPSQPTEPTSNLVFNASKVKSIYNNINSLLNKIKNDQANRLFKLKYSYLNDTTKQTKTSQEGFMTTVLNSIMKTMNTKDLSKAIKKTSFDVDRYSQTIIFTINFFPKALTSTCLNGNPNVSYGNDGQDKNSLVMSFKMPNIGLDTYVTYHVMEKVVISLQEYVQGLYDESITNIDYDYLNNHSQAIIPIMIKHGVNYHLVYGGNPRFAIPTLSTNRVEWDTMFHNDQVTYDPNCTNPNPEMWDFNPEWGYFTAYWHGDLSHLFDGGRIDVMDMAMQQAMTQFAQAGIRDGDQLEKKINTPAFSKRVWTAVFNYGFRFIDQGTNLIPTIHYTQIKATKDEYGNDIFIYKYSFSIPKDTPIGKGLATDPWFVENYEPIKTVGNQKVIQLKEFSSAPFVPDTISF